MITIQATDVAELRKIFFDLFGAVTVATEPTPKAATKPAVKKEEPAPEPKIEQTEMKTVTVDVQEETAGDGRTATYDEVIAKIKTLKASTHPNIVELMKNWKTSGNYPDLKQSSPEQLGNAMTYIESLEG